MRTLRFDTYRLDKAEQMPDGSLKIQAVPTRAGVLTYRRADGSQVRELRHPDEVFRPDSLATLAGRALTDLHPSTGAVTPATWKSASVGHVGESVTHDGRLVHATVYVHDADAIQKIQSGERKELSAGYYADTEDAPGTYDGQPYDRIQRNVVYNHLSLQPPGGGRAGPECALRIDSDDAILVDDSQAVPDTARMALRIDGKDHNDEKTAQGAIDALTSDRDKLKGALAVAESTATDLQVKLDGALDPKRLQAAVAERVRLLADIRKGNAHYLRADADEEAADTASSTDPIELMTEALTKWRPSLDVKGKSPDVIMGAFLAMMAAVSEPDGDEGSTQAQDAIGQPIKSTAPEMELNGTSATARARLHSVGGGKLRRDDRGFPITDAAESKSAEDEQKAYYENRANAPMAASAGKVE